VYFLYRQFDFSVKFLKRTPYSAPKMDFIKLSLSNVRFKISNLRFLLYSLKMLAFLTQQKPFIKSLGDSSNQTSKERSFLCQVVLRRKLFKSFFYTLMETVLPFFYKRDFLLYSTFTSRNFSYSFLIDNFQNFFNVFTKFNMSQNFVFFFNLVSNNLRNNNVAEIFYSSFNFSRFFYV
jgi:hypothetical protein